MNGGTRVSLLIFRGAVAVPAPDAQNVAVEKQLPAALEMLFGLSGEVLTSLSSAQQKLLQFVQRSRSQIQSALSSSRATVSSLLLAQRRPVGSGRMLYHQAAENDFEGSRRTFDRDRQRVSMCCLHFSEISWQLMLQRFERSFREELEPVAIMKSRRYDETPTQLRLPQPVQRRLPAKMRGVLNARPRVASTAKVLQTKMEVAFLMKAKATGQFKLCRSTIVCPLQLVDACTIENIRWAQSLNEERVPGLQAFSRHFPTKVSLPATDRHWSNRGAERAIFADDSSWSFHHFFCDVHKAAQVQKCQFDLMSGNVSAMLLGRHFM